MTKSIVRLLFTTLCVATSTLVSISSCSRPFHTCYETRTCPPKVADSGSAGEAGASGQPATGGASGDFGEQAGGSGEGATAGAGGEGLEADGGEPGASDSPVDECSAGSSTCSVNAICHDAGPGFTCECKPGYVGNGTTCELKSCVGLPSKCGSSSNDDCCASEVVTGGTFVMGNATTASVSTFVLDKYEVTVGRFRQFVRSYIAPPLDGAGRHPLIANSGWQVHGMRRSHQRSLSSARVIPRLGTHLESMTNSQ